MDIKLRHLITEYGSLPPDVIEDYYRTSSKYGNAFVINMKNRTERLKEATATLDRAGIPFYRFIALDGKQILNDEKNLPPTERLSSKFSILRPGEFGCVLSHLAILSLAASHPDQDNFTLIFEDDIVSNATSISQILDDITDIDERDDIGIVYLGKCLETCGKLVKVKDNIYRGVAPSCCHAYMVKNSFARKVLDDFDSCNVKEPNCEWFNRGIDSILGDYIKYDLVNSLVLHPAIFYQDVLTGGSDLRKEYMMNYLECNDTTGNDPPPPTQSTDRWILGISVILFIALVLFVIGSMMIGVIVIVIIILLSIIWILRHRSSKPPSESFTAVSLTDLGLEPQNVSLDPTMLINRDYKAFNPNGIMHNGESIIVMRASNGKVSYPLLEFFDSAMTLLTAKKIHIASPKPLINVKAEMGYEDMRLFSYDNELYLIGANLDRNLHGNPSMVLSKLNTRYSTIQTWHLIYKQVYGKPNKNWSPLTLPNGELGFIVNIDPFLVVKRGPHLDEQCVKVYEWSKQLKVDALRNSTIAYAWKDIPSRIRMVFDDNSSSTHRYLLLVHTKYVSPTSLILYQHYFALVDLDEETVRLSQPFHVEQSLNPHIEYISGMLFPSNSVIRILYGLRDETSKYLDVPSSVVAQLWE